MKRLFLIAMMALLTIPILAQDIPPIVDIMDVITNLGLYLGSFPGIVVLITFATALLLRFVKVEGKVLKFLAALIVSLIVVSISNIANFGYLADVTWLVAILNGVGTAICSSLLFNVPIMKQILEWIEGQINRA